MKKYKAYLRKRPQYGEMINEVDNPPKFKLPDRRATFLRNTHLLSQFDDDHSFIGLEEQESNIAKEQMLQQAIKMMAGKNGLTHASLQARSSMAGPDYPSPTDYDSFDSDVTGYADSTLQRRDLEKRAKELAIAERGTQLLEEHEKKRLQDHILTTADGLFGDPEPEETPKPVGRTKKDFFFKPKNSGEQASSSTSRPVYPSGVNPVTIPKAVALPTHKRLKITGERPPRIQSE